MDADGNVLDGRSVTWSSSNTEVASVSSTGEVTTLSAGTAEIKATSEGKEGSAILTVTLAPIHTITVVIADPSMQVGGTRQASAVAKDANGNVLTGRAIVWTTDDAEVATVSTQGVVAGLKAGTATITATSEGKSGSETVTVSEPSAVIRQRSLALGGSHTCAIATDGAAYCWGANYNGQSGNAVRPNAQFPVLVEGGHQFAALAAKTSVTYGLAIDGRFYCWGGVPCDPFAPDSYFDPPVGPAVYIPRLVPTPRPLEVLGENPTSHRYEPSCAIAVGGVAYCWGSNLNGELGLGTNSSDTLTGPERPVVGNYAFIDIASSGHSCGLTISGAAYCWGRGGSGELGDGSGTSSPEPRLVAGDHVFKDIGVGTSYSCGITTSGEAYCWGANNSGQLGTTVGNCLGGTLPCSATPVRVSGGHIFESLSVGQGSCAITSAGDVYCWGHHFGSAPTRFRSALAGEPGGVTFRVVSVGGGHACAIATTGDMYCRGRNNIGQLGNGTTKDPQSTPDPEPTLVLGGIKWRTP
jgi:alpha-tubulin suppressor-like RCC1 family protein